MNVRYHKDLRCMASVGEGSAYYGASIIASGVVPRKFVILRMHAVWRGPYVVWRDYYCLGRGSKNVRRHKGVRCMA